MCMHRWVLSCLLAFTAMASHAAVIEGTLRNDRWHYPFNAASPLGSEQRGALFMGPPPGGPPPSTFNRRDGVVVVQFGLELPAQLQGVPVYVTSATLTFWGARTDTWSPQSTNTLGRTAAIEIFAARFGPGLSESDWDGSQAFIGSNGFTAIPRDPWPADLLTLARVEDNVTTATAWGFANPIGYTPGAMTEAFPLVANLNTAAGNGQQEFRDDLATGLSTWVITSTFEAAQGGPPVYPRVILTEGVGNTTFGSLQQPPSLRVEVVPVSAARAWNIYQ